jgi:hypothetical protein
VVRCAQTSIVSIYTAALRPPPRIEELVRYCARLPVANDRLEKRADGRYVCSARRSRDASGQGSARRAAAPVGGSDRCH